MKLKKLLDLFRRENLNAAPRMTVEEYELLNQFLPEIFPSQEVVSKILENFNLEGYNNYLSYELPYHTRDNQWLVAYVKRVLQDAEAPKIKTPVIREYVETAIPFDVYRNDYEQSLVKGQILYMLYHYMPNAIMDPKYSAQKINHSHNYDKLFRAGVVSSLKCLGMDQHAAEVGVEQNADLWRNITMEETFRNRYYGLNTIPSVYGDYEKRHNWLRLREYQYYCAHQDIIDELGTATPSMKMSPSEAWEIFSDPSYHTYHINGKFKKRRFDAIKREIKQEKRLQKKLQKHHQNTGLEELPASPELEKI